jgi:hypothetical protein
LISKNAPKGVHDDLAEQDELKQQQENILFVFKKKKKKKLFGSNGKWFGRFATHCKNNWR